MPDMTPPSAWAQAVNPLQAAVEAMKCKLPDHDVVAPPCDGDSDTGYCDACLDLKLRAALPHLLRAVTEALDPQDMESLRLTFQTYLGGANVYPAGYAAVGKRLLAALTDAAGRVGG